LGFKKEGKRHLCGARRKEKVGIEPPVGGVRFSEYPWPYAVGRDSKLASTVFTKKRHVKGRSDKGGLTNDREEKKRVDRAF